MPLYQLDFEKLNKIIGNPDINNVAIGYNALNNTKPDGSGNVAVGYYTLATNTHGSSNNALGTQALEDNTTGKNNNAFGSDALTYNTTGNSNIAIGSSALFSNKTGSSNIAMGTDTLSGSVNDSSNIAIGENSLYSCSGTFGNVAVGPNSLSINVRGSKNVVVGFNGAYNLEGSGNTFIGANVDLSTNAYSVDNNIVIGTGDGVVRAHFDSSENWIFSGSNIVFDTANNTRSSVSAPGITGQIVFDNTSSNMYYYNGTNWIIYEGALYSPEYKSVNAIQDESQLKFMALNRFPKIVIPPYALHISDGLFQGNTALVSVEPYSVCNLTNIGPNAFQHCTSLTSITIPKSVTTIGTDAFSNVPGPIKIYRFHPSSYTFDASRNLRNPGGYIGEILYVDEPVTEIYDFEFSGNLMTSYSIPSSVRRIGIGAFLNDVSLATVTFENIANSQLTLIDGSYNDYDGTSYGAFDGCTSLTSITIPKSVTKIGYGAFNDNTSLNTVTFDPSSSLGLIDGGAFVGCTSLTSITIPKSVTKIGNGAFNRDITLKMVTFDPSSSLGIIEYGAFDGCISLTSITIPKSVTTIGLYAFYSVQGPITLYSSGYTIDISSVIKTTGGYGASFTYIP
jgi:hypothetical protein